MKISSLVLRFISISGYIVLIHIGILVVNGRDIKPFDVYPITYPPTCIPYDITSVIIQYLRLHSSLLYVASLYVLHFAFEKYANFRYAGIFPLRVHSPLMANCCMCKTFPITGRCCFYTDRR